MIHLKELFNAIAYCNQHIKEHKSECKIHDISPSRFYNVKQDIVRYLILSRDTYGLSVTITSHEMQHNDIHDAELIGILFKTQHLDELHIHQVYNNVDDIICPETLPDLKEYVPKRTLIGEWDEQEFVKKFNTIIQWAIETGIEKLYPLVPDSYFVQKIVRWYPHFHFTWGSNKQTVSIKKDITVKGKYRTYTVKQFRKNVTKILE